MLPKDRFPVGVKSHAGDVVLRVDWLILADAKCRAERLTSSKLFHNRIIARATFYLPLEIALKFFDARGRADLGQIDFYTHSYCINGIY